MALKWRGDCGHLPVPTLHWDITGHPQLLHSYPTVTPTNMGIPWTLLEATWWLSNAIHLETKLSLDISVYVSTSVPLCCCVIVYSHAIDNEVAHQIIYNGFINELINVLELPSEELTEMKAAVMRTLTAIIHLERNPKLVTTYMSPWTDYFNPILVFICGLKWLLDCPLACTVEWLWSCCLFSTRAFGHLFHRPTLEACWSGGSSYSQRGPLWPGFKGWSGCKSSVLSRFMIRLVEDGSVHFSRLDAIIDITGANTYHGFLPSLVRKCILHMVEPNLTGFPHAFSTALFSFLYHLASYESGGEALLSCGIMPSLLKLASWHSDEQEHITVSNTSFNQYI